jgi:DAK2 domain fusion protein YloV
VSAVPTVELLGVDALRDTLSAYGDVLHAHAGRLNRLNVYPVPDGDTGTNMARTLEAVVAEMQNAPVELEATCDAISYGALMGARGNSGVIMSQILRGIASTLKAAAAATGTIVATALETATTGAYAAVLVPVEGTILTVVRASAEAARWAADAGGALGDVLRAARDAGGEALARTPELLPVLKDAGVVDAGGAGFLLLLDAALHVVDGEPLPSPPDAAVGADGPVLREGDHAEVVERGWTSARGDEAASDTAQRYEVMFLCNLADDDIGALKSGWGAIGDSIVVVGGDGVWNCHVHTNDIGAAIETALDLGGRPFKIRVTDLVEEIAAEHASREAELTATIAGAVAADSDVDLPSVTCAVVAVSSGDGISDLFRDLGVQVVVPGGQTLNPSTAELLAAVERANANHVVLLPGNKNIIPVAEQVDALTSKTVRVVPTRSMPEGLAALMAYDPEVDAPANVVPMRQAAEAVVTGEVTRAVRASNTPAGPVAEGDWLGIVRGDGVVAIAGDVVSATKLLLERLIGDDRRELITVLTGADVDDDDTAELQRWISARFPDVDVEVHGGRQPHYPYLLGVE